ncbi:DEAD/DEAH box helicase [uncultured Pseudoalteromonas sp.]|uniref:DEAD/DEAH box helicase n=1 Tax=uncultured Pseudoalteromonas sp. TaxID=114053 RepID=UPI002598CF4D|nr:DEAD/DEAH box helicase [uncultured Pseudoalteromonas sp.]
MALKDLFSQFFTSADRSLSFSFEPHEIEGGIFSLPQQEFVKLRAGNSNEWLTYQYVTLKMLEEQGEAQSIPNGFIVPANVLTCLDDEACSALGLPPKWHGKLKADIKGTTGRANFKVDLQVTGPHGLDTYNYKIKGPIIQFGSSQQFMLTAAELNLFDALSDHFQSEKSENDNLNLIYALQSAQSQGVSLQLQHFDKLKIHKPEQVTIELDVDNSGNLVLTPQLGQDASHEQMQRVLGQLDKENCRTLKVGEEIILFDEQKLQAVKEVIENRFVPKSRVQAFLDKPSAFINSSLVDLDLGFSVRVKGATSFKHAYFGDTDESGIDWFGQVDGTSTVTTFAKIIDEIDDEETFKQVSQKVADASATGAALLHFEGNDYDISDPNLIESTLNEVKNKLSSKSLVANDNVNNDDETMSTKQDVIVVDIELNDEDLISHSSLIDSKVAEVSRKGDLDWGNYKRMPYKHQEIGVRWALGLFDKAEQDEQIKGALLADDMGLGKTFMALSAIEHHYRELENRNLTKKPILIVAPLSLLENWQDEVGKTFDDSPFTDIVILQSDAQLKRFKNGGIETRSSLNDSGEFTPRYSLNVGKEYVDRLDMPGRLVITTYHTLRDYQFSLCLVDWGVVVFDEAQNIKNPNALQTRAAKGLKSTFKLVATGTPVENSLADFWCLMDTACPGYLGAYQEFRAKYMTPIVRASQNEVDRVRASVGRDLRLVVGALMLRRVKEDNLDDLPAKVMYTAIKSDVWEYHGQLGSTMCGYEQDVYDRAIEDMHSSADGHVLSTIQKLRNCSLHPKLASEEQLVMPKSDKELDELLAESGKLQSLLRLLKEIQCRDEKCIIFALNKRLQTFLSLALGSYFSLGPITVINGDAKAVAKSSGTPTRKSMIKSFEDKAGFNLIIMSPVAAGVGLTVVGANNVVHYERHWNPAKEAQATDRVYRIGQTKDVNIYVPLLFHPELESFDVNLHRLLANKTMLRDAVVTPEAVNEHELMASMGL